MKSAIFFICLMLMPISASLAAESSCFYSDTSIVVNKYETLCAPTGDGKSSCRFPLCFSVTSDCKKDAEIFYLCKTSIEASVGGLFSTPQKSSTDTIGSLVIRNGAGKGTANVQWESAMPVENVKVTQLNCYATDIYPIDEQK